MNDELRKLMETGILTAESIKTDSRKVQTGDLFVAMNGADRDGHDYVKQAIASGAVSVVCEHVPGNLSGKGRDRLLIVENSREALGDIAGYIYNDPSGSLSVYGVTGTNGKTSTVFLIDSILTRTARSSGLISTVYNRTSGNEKIRSKMTTPDPMELNRLLAEMVLDGKYAAVVEMSSHALRQQRVHGIKLDSAVFTNITPEHLDYHKDMESYLRDKARIFQYLNSDGTAILNGDDFMVSGLQGDLGETTVITFGIETPSDIMAENIQLCGDRTEFDLSAKGIGSIRIKTGLIGKHNVYNILAAASAVLSRGLSLDEVRCGVESAPAVPGRLDLLKSDAPFRVFVDYAHTPDALEHILICLRALTEHRLICVFGCGGDRDSSKRPIMGRVATEVCDLVVMTDDNPRSEDPNDILDQIEKGVRNKTNYSIMRSRSDAINKALRTAENGDIVVIAGKGHEDYQITGDVSVYFDDKETAYKVLRELGYKVI